MKRLTARILTFLLTSAERLYESVSASTLLHLHIIRCHCMDKRKRKMLIIIQINLKHTGAVKVNWINLYSTNKIEFLTYSCKICPWWTKYPVIRFKWTFKQGKAYHKQWIAGSKGAPFKFKVTMMCTSDSTNWKCSEILRYQYILSKKSVCSFKSWHHLRLKVAIWISVYCVTAYCASWKNTSNFYRQSEGENH